MSAHMHSPASPALPSNTAIAPGPLLDAIKHRVRSYSSARKNADETRKKDAEIRPVVEPTLLQTLTKLHNEEMERLDIRLQNLRQQRIGAENEISILCNHISLLDHEIEQTARSQEQAKTKARERIIQEHSNIRDRYRDEFEKRLLADSSRDAMLIDDIIRILSGKTTCAGKV
ncbi:hypothetical protein LY78DRAFT_674622 [Colletotrichum sublineola]|uniref:Uncharacterized protein n=1 Tax=Colletotrichum sublineola TaxID=1173701 RepID=A0A066XFA3_COLSU|nr:hypothetical protein LY78DRAFT_674622 [Colletotrichum sublineola]KDN67868.1 hypothetical protein CSUB01_12510 [Colletotrichum sublineola]